MPGTLTTAVVAHRARQAHAEALADLTSAETFWDDGTLGCEANHRRAWQWLEPKGTDWGVVLEDDALPVQGFNSQLEQALIAAPTPIVSLYLGRRRPPDWQSNIHRGTTEADKHDAHFITATHLIHAVGVAIRTALIPDMLDHTYQSVRPWDFAIAAWAVTREHMVSYTWPSLVDHRDQGTLFRHKDKMERTPGRVAWRTGTRESWATKAVPMIPC